VITTTANLNRKLGYLSSQKKIKIFKDTYCQKRSAIFPMSEWRWMFFAEAIADHKWKNTKLNCKTTGGVPSHIWSFLRVKTTPGIPCKSIQCYCAGDGCLVRQPFVTNLSAVKIKLTEVQENLAQKTLVSATLHLIFGESFRKYIPRIWNTSV